MLPAPGQVLRKAADPIPGRMHAKTGNALDHLIGPLAVGEAVEHRRHGAQVLQVGPQEQQMAGDAEYLRHHHPDRLDPVRHLDTRQLLNRQDIGKVVHHTAGVVDAVGIGNEAVPGLALGHLFRAPVVIANIRHAVDDLFAVQLKDYPECTVGRGMIRAQVEEHKLAAIPLTLHTPGFRFKFQRLLLRLLPVHRQGVGIEFRSPRGVVLA